MIERERVAEIWYGEVGSPTLGIDKIMALITEQDEKYREHDADVQFLIEAAIDYTKHNGVSGADGRALILAVQPFLPPKPSLSQLLKELRPRICQDDSIIDNELKEYIEAARKLEDRLKAVNCD